jgi:hypothetical protein
MFLDIGHPSEAIVLIVRNPDETLQPAVGSLPDDTCMANSYRYYIPGELGKENFPGFNLVYEHHLTTLATPVASSTWSGLAS